MLKFIGLILFLQCQLLAFGQENTVDVTGIYHYKSASFKLNKDQTCKIVFTFPQKLIYEGFWKLQNDTLVCTYHHINITIEGVNEELKEDPFSQKFLLTSNTLSLMDGQYTGTVVYLKEDN